MGFIKDIDDTRQRLADVWLTDKERVEKLRLIMCKEQGREVSFEEARQTGTDLVEFYTILAQGKKIVAGGLKNKDRWREV